MTDIQISPDWLKAPALLAVFDALEAAGGEVRVNGGAVRNALMGEPVSDVDLSTTLHPPQVIEALRFAGLKAVPTGIEHGTVTAVSDGTGFEVTTLREDVETDGRRAVVKFATDWSKDAERRDLTMNALYLDQEGRVFDPLSGIDDLRARNVRFVGDAETRIREDYLRVLRFFRFFAWYGDGRPDAAGLKASAKLKDGLESLSAERVWAELRKLLAAPDPSRALLWMRTTGVLTKVLPESEKWGIDAIKPLIEAEQKFGWEPDALLRLQAMIPPREDVVQGLAKRLKLPNAVRDRLLGWAHAPDVAAVDDSKALRAALYGTRKHPHAVTDRLKLKAATASEGRAQWLGLLADADAFSIPELPVSGQDLLDHGFEAGKVIGEALAKAEAKWVASDFSMSKNDLLNLIQER
ncbi:MAG: CCA tRNA nucleotidyltransferase [Pseudomonadota bacterium]